MADIFNEVDEDIRRERAMRLWAEYGRYVIALAVLIVLGVAGWRVWQTHRETEAQAAGARFEQALQLDREGKTAEARAAMTAISQDGPAGYKVLARFRLAAETAATDRPGAVKAYDALADDGSLEPAVRDMARIRAATLLVDTAPYAEVQTRMEALSQPTSPWRHAARELLGLAAWRAKDLTNATSWYEMLLSDPGAPQGLHQRAETMMQLIAAEQPAKQG